MMGKAGTGPWCSARIGRRRQKILHWYIVRPSAGLKWFVIVMLIPVLLVPIISIISIVSVGSANGPVI
jgi:hypothetical protein